MPGMRERKLHMMGETKSSRGDYSKIKGYESGGMVRVGQGKAEIPGVADAIASATQAKKKKLRRRQSWRLQEQRHST